MACTADYPRPLDQMTHAELYEAAVAAGMTFEILKSILQLDAGPKAWETLQIGSGLLGYDRDRTRRVCAIEAARCETAGPRSPPTS